MRPFWILWKDLLEQMGIWIDQRERLAKYLDGQRYDNLMEMIVSMVIFDNFAARIDGEWNHRQ